MSDSWLDIHYFIYFILYYGLKLSVDLFGAVVVVDIQPDF